MVGQILQQQQIQIYADEIQDLKAPNDQDIHSNNLTDFLKLI